MSENETGAGVLTPSAGEVSCLGEQGASRGTPIQSESKASAAKRRSWTDIVPVYPATGLFPMMSKGQLNALGADIEANGLRAPVAMLGGVLLDGRNRLAAMEAAGLPMIGEDGKLLPKLYIAIAEETEGFDPVAFVFSANRHRRHLNRKQKRELIGKLLTDYAERSDSAIAKLAAVSDKTVAAVRAEMASRSEIPNVENRTDSKGRQQPATKPVRKASAPKPAAATAVSKSQARDKEIAAVASKLSNLSGSALADEIETRIRLITDVKWSTVSRGRRDGTVALLRKMIERIESAPDGGGGDAPTNREPGAAEPTGCADV